MANAKIVFFDGVCNLCSASVQFLIRHDRKQQLRYASLQSPFANVTLHPFHLKPGALTSIIFLDGDRCYTHSDAVIELTKYLDGGYRLLYIFRFVPRFIRDFFYKIVAKNRYRFFGKKAHCWLPNPELKSLFLD